ncbi:DUF211 domain-containing protein [Halomicroarcula sp. GCM10025709]|uniref:DUF211 domain-containing protein n=1 Tax=Haloarcula TaxID=2237 RepID=UPI0024C46DDD|nr:DUF211 domain-containing protein [Halomicroarcula sp. YJ-61-S]
MAPVRRLVLDVLKPHDPELLDFTQQLAGVGGVEGVNATLIEHDQEVQNVKLTFEGASLSLDEIQETVEAIGATVHSVDQVALGEYLVENRPTPQD